MFDNLSVFFLTQFYKVLAYFDIGKQRWNCHCVWQFWPFNLTFLFALGRAAAAVLRSERLTECRKTRLSFFLKGIKDKRQRKILIESFTQPISSCRVALGTINDGVALLAPTWLPKQSIAAALFGDCSLELERPGRQAYPEHSKGVE